MNKGDLIDAVAAKTGESRANSARFVDTVLGCIIEGVNRDGKVAIAGFGTFKKKHRKARMGMNPITRLPMEIKPSTIVGFTPSETLRNGV